MNKFIFSKTIKCQLKIIMLFVFFIICKISYASDKNNSLCNAFINGQGADLRIKINDFERYHDTKNLNLGFNLELAQIKDSIGDYGNEGIVELVKQLKPNALRYPGGTPANYFDWKDEQLDEKSIQNHANKHIRKLLKKQKRKNKGKVPSADLNSYSKLISDYDMRSFVVLNMFKSNKEIKYAVDKVKREIIGPVFWELGNEVSNEGYQKRIKLKNDKLWTVDSYVQRINIVSDYIKSRYPQDKVGVVASEMAKMRNPDNIRTWYTEKKRETWDSSLLQSVKYFDAVIVHPYIYSADKFVENVKIPCKPGLELSNNIKYRLWVMSNVSNLPELYTVRLAKRFPGKEVWLTEFGIIDQSAKSVDEKLKKQSGFRVLSTAANYLSWMKAYPQVNTWLIHGMFVGYDWAHIVYPDLSYTANGVAYAFVKEFLSRVDEVSNVEVVGQLVMSGIDSYENLSISPIVAISGRNQATGLQSMILTNITNHNLLVELPWKVTSILSGSFAWDGIIEPGKINSIKDFNNQIVNSKIVSIKPRSIVLFEANK